MPNQNTIFFALSYYRGYSQNEWKRAFSSLELAKTYAKAYDGGFDHVWETFDHDDFGSCLECESNANPEYKFLIEKIEFIA